jgi:uncharacterized protein (TIRG00374 family)
MPAANSSDKSQARKFVPIILRLLIASFILFFIFRKIPISEVGSAMGQTDLRYALAAFFATFFVHLGASYRLQKLCELQTINLSAFEVFKVNTSSRFYGLFLPGGNFTGIAIRFYRLSVFKQKYAQALFAMLSDRIFATISLCIMGILFWIIELPGETESYFELMVIVLVSLAVILILTALIKPAKVLSALMERIGRFKPGKNKLFTKLADYQPQLSSSAFSNMLLLSCIIHFLGIISYYLISVGMGLNLSFVSIGWIRSAVMLVTMVPVSISGIGLREGAMVLLLGIYNIQADDALAFSFIVFSVTVLGIGIIGAIFEAGRLLK